MTEFTRAEAFAPATVANLGVGFDILGLAVDGPGDTVIAEWNDGQASVTMARIEGDHGFLPLEASKNVASIAAQALYNAVQPDRGVALTLRKGLPISSGLGSSAASSVAAVVAVNSLLDEPFAKRDLLPFALEGEKAVSGSHADNIAPSLLGGITLVNGVTVDQIQMLPVPEHLHLALVTPDVEVETAKARAALPKMVLLTQLVAHTAAVAELVDALYRGDVVAMARAMEADLVVEPARKHLMPLLDDVRFAAKRAGAHALVISGAGPTLCAVCDDVQTAAQVADTMQQIYEAADIGCRVHAGSVARAGARVVERV